MTNSRKNITNSDEYELLDTHENTGSDFCDEEDAVLLADCGDDNDGDECVNDHFLLGDIDHYNRLNEDFTGMCGLENSTQDVTDTVHIFDQFLIWIWYRTLQMSLRAMHSNSKILEAILFLSSPE